MTDMPTTNKSVEWYSPAEIVSVLGPFDLDPCSPARPLFKIADQYYTKEDNGLVLPWYGRVWLNPPYGGQVKYWVKKMYHHNNGIALVFVRTETEWFQRFIFSICSSMLFIEGRVNFLMPGGMRAKNDGGAASVLIAYGQYNSDAIASSGIPGRHVLVNTIPFVVIGVSSSWKQVVSISLGWLNGSGSLQDIYKQVEVMAPDKVGKNIHFEAKVRQTLQTYFLRIGKGYWAKKDLQKN